MHLGWKMRMISLVTDEAGVDNDVLMPEIISSQTLIRQSLFSLI